MRGCSVFWRRFTVYDVVCCFYLQVCFIRSQLTTGRTVLILWVAIAICAISYAVWENHEFEALTPGQHLTQAKENAIRGGNLSIDIALRHINAIPSNAVEAQEAATLAVDLQTKKQAVEDAVKTRRGAKAYRDSAIVQLQKDLKSLGYDLAVEQSEVSGEVVIKSAEFTDTDHRVRFLAFIRNKNSPASEACLAGFVSVRLKSSIVFGFDESYSLECSN
jgi:hypothetical protein